MSNDGVYYYFWNGESQMAWGGGVSYTYDGDGRRVSKTSGNETQSCIGMARRRNSFRNQSFRYLITDHIYFAGKRVATVRTI